MKRNWEGDTKKPQGEKKNKKRRVGDHNKIKKRKKEYRDGRERNKPL